MGLKKIVEKVKPNFEKGGKYEKWLPVFESFETFFFVLGNVTPKKGCHIRDAIDMKRLMSVVIIALMPALLFGMWNVGYHHYQSLGETSTLLENFGYGALKVIPLILVSYIFGLGTEFIFVFIKGKEIEEGFLVSGMLVPLIVPVDVPLWMLGLANIFAVIFGKEVFGGTGMNIVNPALLSRAFLFFAYPTKMSGDLIWVSGLEKGEGIVNGFSGATPLANAASTVGLADQVKQATIDGKTELVSQLTSQISSIQAKLPSVWDAFVGTIPGSVGETSFLAILIGAIILIFTGVGSWKIITSVFAGGLIMGLLLNAFGANPYMTMPAHMHLLLGGFAFGAVFMATDPVTASQTEKGKWIYGFLIGFIAILVRVINPAYPEGMMLAILLMNVFAPVIDYYVVKGNIKKRVKRMKAVKA